MKKYPIDNFYIGKLNIEFPRNNAHHITCWGGLLNPTERELYKFVQTLVNNGAIDLDKMSIFTYINNTLFRYTPLLTIFYKMDNDKYVCLHNGNSYSTDNNNGIFCDELFKLSDCVPRFGFNLPNELSIYYAIKIFNILFSMKKKMPYNNDKYNIDYFYSGELYFCDGYYDSNKRYHELNIPVHILLQKQDLCRYNGLKRVITVNNEENELSYSAYKSVFLRLDDENYYNLNTYKIYNISEYNDFSDKVIIKNPLIKEKEYRPLNDFETIPRILKKQKNI